MSAEPVFAVTGYADLLIGEPKTILNSANVDAEIKNFSPSSGWIERQSALSIWGTSDNAWMDNPNNGAILTAEFYRDDSSLMIRFDSGRWILRQINEQPGSGYRFDDWDYVSVHKGLMRYRRYWKNNGNGIVPVAYRFVGFV